MSISSFVLMIHHLASLTGSFCLLTIHLDGPVFYLDIQSDCKHINFHKKGKCCNTELESPFCVYHLNTYIHYLQAIFILSVFISKVFNLVNFLCINKLIFFLVVILTLPLFFRLPYIFTRGVCHEMVVTTVLDLVKVLYLYLYIYLDWRGVP